MLPFDMFRFTLILVALIVMFIDYTKHKNLNYVFMAYLFLALSSAIVMTTNLIHSPYLDIAVSFSGITMAGMLFALNAYFANKRMVLIRKRAKKVFR